MPALKPMNRILSMLLVLTLFIGLLPSMVLRVRAEGETHTFTNGAIYLDESYSGDTVYILGDVDANQDGVDDGGDIFSVTVNGATNVTIVFNNVTMDRRAATDPMNGNKVENLYYVSQQLNATETAQTCPFLITGNSSVNAHFHGTCTFYAGTNGCSVASDNTYSAVATGCGFAAIQVDSNASLTIEYAADLTVYGAHQLGSPDANGNITANDVTANYSDVLRANHDITAGSGTSAQTIYDDPWTNQYQEPANATRNEKSGGAGIGGGAGMNTDSSSSTSYTAGTPGTIIINGGNIEAFGGHQAAGIGGGYNGAVSNITINGGVISAHGGRWAAGIGDGDSAPDAAATAFTDGNSPNYITINDGTVTAYGGVASAGIGCTDSLGSLESCLEIAVNGGTINAFSGFPDGFSGSGSYSSDQNAPAAIGSGSKSVMNSNSIYISSAAILTCAAFGNYALTEIGNNANTVPTINVDSDGYLLLLRTDEYYSSQKRLLELYLPLTAMVECSDGEGGTQERECYVYVNQSDGTLYYMDKQQYDEHKNYIFFDIDGNLLAEIPDNLTLYVDEENTKSVDEIELAYYFRSIALTLPHPEQYGGLYALTVPIDGVNQSGLPDDHIILTVEAHEQGTQSGVVTYPADNNLKVEDVADALTDLDAYEGDVTPSGDGLIGDDFMPRVYAYTVYVESTAEYATLYASFEDDGATSYSLTLNNNSVDAVDHGSYRDITQVVTLTGDQTTVRLKKQDGTNSLGAITYKITFIKKGDYNLNLTDPSKVYDGTPASVSASGVYTGSLYTIEDVPGAGAQTGTASVSQSEFSKTGNTFYLHYARNNSGMGSGNTTYYLVDIDMALSVLTTDQPNVLNYILTVTTTKNSSSGNFDSITSPVRMGWRVEYDESTGAIKQVSRLKTDPQSAGGTWIATSDCAIAAASITTTTWNPGSGNTTTTTTYYVYLYVTDAGLVQIYRSNNDTKYKLFELGSAAMKTDGSNTKAAAKAAAQAALDAGATEGAFAYSTNAEYTWTQNLTIGTVKATSDKGSYTNSVSSTDQLLTNTYSTTGDGYYQIVAGGDNYTSVPATKDELDNAVFTWYRIEGDSTETLLTGPPTDAGNYRVDAVLHAETYNAAGSRTFTISTRPVTVLQIQNWLIYLEGKEVAELETAGIHTLAIDAPGTITLYNVIGGDDVTLSGWDQVYYNSIGVTYSSDKISIIDPVLTGADAPNYHIVYTKGFEDNNEVRVFGQIAYSTNGTIFRKTEDGTWLKFYPVDVSDPVIEGGEDVDYHSPKENDETYGAYLSHAEYVKARTVNEDGAARYAVDLEYGAMQFTYYYGTWNVNTLVYNETEGSFWSGHDGTNNKLTITNYSNQPVYFTLSVSVLPQYADYIGDGTGITVSITANADGSGAVSGSTWLTLPQAAAGNDTDMGTPADEEYWLILTGVPRVPESVFTTVGSITLTVAPANNSS